MPIYTEEELEKMKAAQGVVDVFDVEKLIKMGVIEETLEPSPGLKVKMHTMSESDRRAIMVGAGTSTQPIQMVIPTLVTVISEINGRVFKTGEDRAQLAQVLQQMQSKVVDSMFIAYGSLVEKQEKLFGDEETKKNS